MPKAKPESLSKKREKAVKRRRRAAKTYPRYSKKRTSQAYFFDLPTIKTARNSHKTAEIYNTMAAEGADPNPRHGIRYKNGLFGGVNYEATAHYRRKQGPVKKAIDSYYKRRV
jgi:hypothetical protein